MATNEKTVNDNEIVQDTLDTPQLSESYGNGSVLDQNVGEKPRTRNRIVSHSISGLGVSSVIRNTYGRDAIFIIDGDVTIDYSVDGTTYVKYIETNNEATPIIVKNNDYIKFPFFNSLTSINVLL